MRNFLFLTLLPIALMFVGNIRAETPINTPPKEQLFTVNFKNVSIKEYLKFLSEIGKLNFIYDESELNFAFTLQSDQPASLDVLKTALVQVLRIHDFNIIEDQNNVLITKSTKVKSVSPVIKPGQSLPHHQGAPPIMTKVIKIRYREPKEIIKLISPLLSNTSFVEVSEYTSQIILSDTLNNLSNVQNLINVIDSTDLAYNYEFYSPTTSNVLDLSTSAQKILAPLTNNATFYLFPNLSTRQIVIVAKEGMIKIITNLLNELDTHGPPKETFIVQIKSTTDHENLEKAIKNYAQMMNDKNPIKSVLQSVRWSSELNVFLFRGPEQSINSTVDTINKVEKLIESKDKSSSIHHYQIEFATFPVIKNALNAYAANLPPNSPKRTMIEQMQYVQNLHFIILKGSESNYDDIVSIIKTVDSPKGKTSREIFTYNITHGHHEIIAKTLNDYAREMPQDSLEKKMIETKKYLSQTNQFVFSGSQASYDKVSALLKNIDLPEHKSSQLFTYNITHGHHEIIAKTLNDYAREMPQDSLEKKMIETKKYLSQTNQFVFSGSQASYDKVSALLKNIDLPEHKGSQLFTYNIVHSSYELLSSSLEKYAQNMPKDSNERKMIEAKKYLPQTNQFVFSGTQASYNKIQNLLEDIDVPKNKNLFSQVFTYNITFSKPDLLSNALNNYASQMPTESPERKMIESRRYLANTNQFVFSGTQAEYDQVSNLLSKIDTPKNKEQQTNVFTYNINHSSYEIISQSLDDYASHMPKDSSEQKMIETKRFLPQTNQLIFSGSEQDFAKISALIKNIDLPKHQSSQVFTYNIVHSSYELLGSSLNHYAKEMPKSSPERKMIETKKYLPQTNQFVFSGTQTSYNQVKDLLENIDVPKNKNLFSQVFTYNITYSTPNLLSSALNHYASQMPSESPERKMIESRKYLVNTNQFVFSGAQSEYDKISALLNKIDIPQNKEKALLVFTYNISHSSHELISQALDKYASHMSKNSSERNMIENSKYLPQTNQLVFSGSKEDFDKISALIKNIDIPEKKADTFVILKLNPGVNPTQLLKEMRKAASHLQKKSLIKSIDNIHYQKNTNSFLISGTPDDINKIKVLVQSYETPKAKTTSSFTIVPLNYISTSTAIEELKNTADHLEQAHIDDPTLIATIRNVKPSSKGNSLVVVGSEQNINSVKELISSIDDQKHVADESATSIISYKIRNQSYSYISKNISNIVTDLTQHNNPKDKMLIHTLNTIRYVPESHIILITGTKTTNDQALRIIEKIDVPSHAKIVPSKGRVYIIYKVKNTSVENLMCAVKDFEYNLKETGSSDQPLFDVLSTLKPLPANNSILINAPNKELLEKAENIISKFDVPYDSDKKTAQAPTGGFVSFKLNFQLGKAITNGLSNIGEDLKKAPDAAKYEKLIEAIRSISYITETNSLLLFGEPSVIRQLKNIIEFLDVPLKQVFIEVLVINVADVDVLQIGLQWGVNGSYRGKFGGSTGSMSNDSVSKDFITSVQGNGNKAIQGTNVPILSNGSIGGIGNLLFHKGQSYLTFGALASAMKAEDDDNLVFNTKLITQDGLSSKIFVGQNVPYTGSIVTTAGLTNQTNANLEYRDIGFNLTILPLVGRDGTVTLDIKQSISDAVSGGASSSSVQGITTNMTTLNTKVRVPNNHFVVLGGQFRNTHSVKEQKVPCLGGLPLIGAAFSYNSDVLERTDSIIFIRPSTVSEGDDEFNYDAITKRQEELIASRIGAEDLAEGIELLKSPCDDDEDDEDEDDEDY